MSRKTNSSDGEETGKSRERVACTEIIIVEGQRRGGTGERWEEELVRERRK